MTDQKRPHSPFVQQLIARYPAPIRAGRSWWSLDDAFVESGLPAHEDVLVLHEERDGCLPKNHWGTLIPRQDVTGG